jgi:hypothetical protein
MLEGHKKKARKGKNNLNRIKSNKKGRKEGNQGTWRKDSN